MRNQRNHPTKPTLAVGSAQAVVGENTGDPAAGAYARNRMVRIDQNMGDIAYQSRGCNEQQEATLAQHILRVVAKDEEEVEVADQMKEPGMQKERCQESQSGVLREPRSKSIPNSATAASRSPSGQGDSGDDGGQ